VSDVTILVVEDNDKNLKLIRDVLQFAGYAVVSAGSGEDGVALAMERPPDLVLMDLQLPGMDGTEALRRLRDSSRTRHVPVVAVTAFAMRDDRERAMDAGFDGYLSKPISVSSLPAQVRGFLQAGVSGSES
jgi:CheY-like chemotaxis protein